MSDENKKDVKQLIVGGIIFLVAILLLVLAFRDWQKQKDDEQMAGSVVSQAVTAAVVADDALRTQQSQEKAEQLQEKPQHPQEEKQIINPNYVNLMFTATTDNDINFRVLYSVDQEHKFINDAAIEFVARAGTNKYNVVLPVKAISRLRLEFGNAPINVVIKDIFLEGTQKEDLNDIKIYELFQFSNVSQSDEGIVFSAEKYSPHAIIYLRSEQKAEKSED